MKRKQRKGQGKPENYKNSRLGEHCHRMMDVEQKRENKLPNYNSVYCERKFPNHIICISVILALVTFIFVCYLSDSTELFRILTDIVLYFTIL